MEDNFYFHDMEAAGRGFKKPDLKQVCILYSLAVILFLFIGSRFQRREFYSGILVTEFVLIMAPTLVFLYMYRYDIKRVLRLNYPGLLNLFLVFCIMVFALPVVGVFNLANLLLIKQVFGRVEVHQLPAAVDTASLILNILVIGGSAGICEEILFRGVIMRGFERFGAVTAILVTAFLFGMMHVDFQKLLGTFLLGALIGFIVYRTNSLFSGIFAHFTNNSIAVLLSFGYNKLSELAKSWGTEDIKQQYGSDIDLSALFDLPRPQLIASIAVWTFIFLFCACVLTGLMIALLKNTENIAERAEINRHHRSLGGVFWAFPGILTISFIYFAQGLKLRGINLEWVNMVFESAGFK